MLHTTFRKAKEAGACASSYKKMAKALGRVRKYGLDTPIPLSNILEVCGLDDTLWSLQIVLEPADREIRLFACDCAEKVLPLFEKQYPNDDRPRQAIIIARQFANGKATKEDLAAARVTACDAWDATSDAARVASWAASWAAEREWQTQRVKELIG